MSSDVPDDDGVIRASLTAIISMFLDQTIWILLLAGLAAVGVSIVVPDWVGAAACAALVVLGIIRCSIMRVVVDGQEVVVANALRTYRFEKDQIAGCDVVTVRRVPPRLRLSVDTTEGRISFNLDATGRLSRRARRRVADRLVLLGVVNNRCARDYAEMRY